MSEKSLAAGQADEKKPKTVKEKLKAMGIKDAKLAKDGALLAADVLKELRDTARAVKAIEVG
jgi:hypothetical protein